MAAILGMDAAPHPGHALDQAGLIVAAHKMGLAVAGQERELCFEVADGSGAVVAGEVADVGLVPRDQGAQAIVVDMVFGPLEPFGAQARVVHPLFVIDRVFAECHDVPFALVTAAGCKVS
jgi:hypothetical protein